MTANVLNDVWNWLLIRLAPPCGRNDAEIAVVNAAACRLENVVGEIVAAGQKFTTRERAIRKVQAQRPAQKRFDTNRITLYVWPSNELSIEELNAVIQRVLPLTAGAGLER